jgi:hypothetical protein
MNGADTRFHIILLGGSLLVRSRTDLSAHKVGVVERGNQMVSQLLQATGYQWREAEDVVLGYER